MNETTSGILLISGNARSSLCQQLLEQQDERQDKSYSLITADYEAPVLSLCENHNVKAVLIEFDAPANEGIELLSQIQKQLSDRTLSSSIPFPIPFIAIGEDSIDLAKRALKAGAADYFAKSQLSSHTLVQVIESVMPLSSSKEAARSQHLAGFNESEETYRALFNSIDEGYLIQDVIYNEHGQPVDLYYVEANPAAVRLIGTQLVGKSAQMLFPNLEPSWLEACDRVAKTGTSERLEESVATLDVWYDAYISKVGNPESRRVVAIFKDITARLKAEEILRRSVQLSTFRVAFTDAIRPLSDTAEIKSVASHLLGAYLKVNRVVYFEMVNASRAYYSVEAGYADGVTIMPPGHYPTDSYGAEPLAKFRRGQTAVVSNIAAEPNISPDQLAAYADIQVAAYITVPLIKNGEFVAGLSINMAEPRMWTQAEIALAEEIAERTWATIERARAEAAVATDLKDMRLLRDLSVRSLSAKSSVHVLYDQVVRIAIALTNADGGTLQVLDEDTQTLTLLSTIGLPKTLASYLGQIAVSANTYNETVLTEGQRQFVDFDAPEHSSSDSSQQYLSAGFRSAQATPLVSRWGKVIGIVSTYWHVEHRPAQRELRFVDLLARQAADIIEQKQASAEREQLLAREQAARQAAERMNRIKDNFLAVLSHELRTPLNPIVAWSQLLLARPLDDDKKQKAYETIQRNAKLQVQLIDDLLDVAKILRGKLEIEESPVDLAKVIEAATEVVRTSAEAKSITLQFTLSDPCSVRGNDARLQQVIWNLLSNAIKFTPSGGQVNIQLKSQNLQAIVTVTDTGKGIQPEFIPYLFESFRQEDASITRQYGGLGLGLSIVKYIVDAHGGAISASSAGEGQGATFTLRLPLIKSQALRPLKPALSTETIDLSGIKVLAVDDNEDAREVLRALLEIYNVTFKAVSSGTEALEVFNEFSPDVLLCDIGMPDMDGYRLLQQIQSLPSQQKKSVPIIALTAYAQVEDRQKALSAGFQKYITKPIDPDELVVAIAELRTRT